MAMKHFFIVNPCAGGKSHVDDIKGQAAALDIDAEVYVTRGTADATRFVGERCREYGGEALRFYACGGDGTLNEVVSGAMGHADVEVGCYPCGSGNDYVKYWPEADFRDLRALTEARTVEVDVMRVSCRQSVRYALNTLNYGFEAEVCREMAAVRHKPLVGGRMAYPTGIVRSLAHGRHNPCRISVDGEIWREGDLLLASLANGRYAGGGFRSAPRSENDDGLLEVTAVAPISVVRFARMIGSYKSGEYLDSEKLRDVVSYCRGRHVTFESDLEFYIGIDGELLCGRRFEVENLHKALRFLVPILA